MYQLCLIRARGALDTSIYLNDATTRYNADVNSVERFGSSSSFAGGSFFGNGLPASPRAMSLEGSTSSLGDFSAVSQSDFGSPSAGFERFQTDFILFYTLTCLICSASPSDFYFTWFPLLLYFICVNTSCKYTCDQ